MENTKRRLIWHGMLLFLLGLITGLIVQQLSNPRMGIAAHLEGVMNGTFLIVIGAIWTEIRLSPKLKTTAYWSLLYGTYLNWGVTLGAAILGTNALTPIAGAGHQGQPWQETVITLGYVSVGIMILLAVILMLWGLRQRTQS